MGEMYYRHSWCREENVDWWGNKSVNVQITAHAYTGDAITDQQRNAFNDYTANITTFIERGLPLILDYVQATHDITYTTEELLLALTPKNVLFQKDGSWGVLFDCEFDIENGLALYKTNDNVIRVGSQDEFL